MGNDWQWLRRIFPQNTQGCNHWQFQVKSAQN